MPPEFEKIEPPVEMTLTCVGSTETLMSPIVALPVVVIAIVPKLLSRPLPWSMTSVAAVSDRLPSALIVMSESGKSVPGAIVSVPSASRNRLLPEYTLLPTLKFPTVRLFGVALPATVVASM